MASTTSTRLERDRARKLEPGKTSHALISLPGASEHVVRFELERSGQHLPGEVLAARPAEALSDRSNKLMTWMT